MTTLTLLPELWLSLLHRAEDHVTRGGGGETVETSTGAVGLNHEEGLGAAVVRTVKDGTGGQTKGHAIFVARGTDDCVIASNRQKLSRQQLEYAPAEYCQYLAAQ